MENRSSTEVDWDGLLSGSPDYGIAIRAVQRAYRQDLEELNQAYLAILDVLLTGESNDAS